MPDVSDGPELRCVHATDDAPDHWTHEPENTGDAEFGGLLGQDTHLRGSTASRSSSRARSGELEDDVRQFFSLTGRVLGRLDLSSTERVLLRSAFEW
jgi:hypothetical protein